MNQVHELKKMTEEELLEYGKLIDSTISSVLIESRSSSPTKSNQARMRLDFWDKKKSELNDFLYKKG
ncbi:hypothetical protein BCT55_20650 [Vibrio splendidus]|mgnify:CR=1 FL=1|uniref:hypothetical protein n=1 Tax=Vibrio TaxID=662 RepID=UPI000C81AA64|nr:MULTISPECIES: hypothetical protein [Vibrio]MBE8564712.1 hypothetical protein [Vibrio sp. OPT20]PMM33636.1 hypothetical protein BCT55_20650 [Vibrio splendidus]TKF06319.1 hypothetical protein FCV46_04315 [Vibrio kanaloae]TKF63753.1 hypothetical protein FCV51_05365 [Vibrio kanaloae]